MILTSREADPQIREAVATGGVVSDDVAETIADWFKAPGAADLPFVALASRGAERVSEAELVALVGRVDALVRAPEWRTSDALPDLHALRAWALCRVPHVVIEEYQLTGDEWQAWCDLDREDCDLDRPEGVKPVDVDVTLIADVAETMSEWVYPGDARYPADPDSFDMDDRDPNGDGRWVPAELITATVGALSGQYVGFYAESYAGNPFNFDVYWHQSCAIEEEGTGRAYASREEDMRDGDVRIRVARLVGFTEEQEVAVWHAWAGR